MPLNPTLNPALVALIGEVVRLDGSSYRITHVEPSDVVTMVRDAALDPTAPYREVHCNGADLTRSPGDDYALLVETDLFRKLQGGYGSPAWAVQRKAELLAKYPGAEPFLYLPGRHVGKAPVNTPTEG